MPAPRDDSSPYGSLGMSHDAARKTRQRAVHKLRAGLNRDQHVA
ncbi:MAG: hypothetical protein ACRD2C_13270 [Acidimicrobiales bacterium]